MRKILICLAALACIAVPAAQAATSLSVVNFTTDPHSSGQMEGTYFMRLTFDGTTSGAYVQDNSPNNEKVYYVSFLLRRDNMTESPSVIGGTTHSAQMFTAFDTETSPTGANIVLRVNLFSNQSGAAQPFAIQVFPKINDGSFATRLASNVIAGNHQWTIEWRAATAPAANDGVARIYRDHSVLKEVTTLNNDTKQISMVRWGAPNTVDATTAGWLDLDSFVSTRTPQF